MVGLGTLAKASNMLLQLGTFGGDWEFLDGMAVWCSGGAWEFFWHGHCSVAEHWALECYVSMGVWWVSCSVEGDRKVQ